MNLHIHPVSLDHASRILKCLESAGRSGCFSARAFIGAGAQRAYEYQDPLGAVQVRTLERQSHPGSPFVKKAIATAVWTRRVNAVAKQLPVSCVNVHGLSTLKLGVGIKRYHRCRLIYDTHELETKAFAVRGIRRFYSSVLERMLIGYCDAVVCVSSGIADWYAAHYRIDRPLVVRNVPDSRSRRPGRPAPNLKQALSIPEDALVFLYQGRIAKGRHVELFLDVFSRLGTSHHLVFMGKGELESMVQKAAGQHRNIHLHPPVAPSEVLGYTAQADVGLVGVENRCLSYYLSLPNKLFECLAAGVPVIVPDLPEMRRVLEGYDCGWGWSGGAENLSDLLERISRDAIKRKGRCARAAGDDLSWEKEEQVLLALYRQLVPKAGS